MTDAESSVIERIQLACDRAPGACRSAGSGWVCLQERISRRDSIINTKRYVTDEHIELRCHQVEEHLLRAIAAPHVHDGDGLRLAVNATAYHDLLHRPGLRMVLPVPRCEATGYLF